MTMRNLKFALLTGACLVATATAANASGFQLKEQGASGQGAAFAGATAKADDLSTLFYNPAGMMRIKPNQTSANVSYIKPSAKFNLDSVTPALGTPTQPNATNNHGGDAGDGGAYVPALYAMTELPNDIRLGLSVNTPFGLSTNYNPGWVGRFYAIESSLKTITVTPTIATNLMKDLSVAVGPQFQYIDAQLTNAVNTSVINPAFGEGLAKMKGSDVGYGYVASVLWSPREDLNLGVTYRSRIHQKLDGDISTTNIPAPVAGVPTLRDANVTAKVTTPDTLSFGVSYDLNDRVKLLADAAWTNWSLFKTLTVKEKGTNLVRQNVNENWEDTYFISGGTEYKYNDKLKLRGGIAFDKSPVDYQDRTFRIPDSDRVWFAGGASYDVTDALTIDAGYTYIYANDVSVTEDTAPATNGVVSGKFDANVHIISVGASYKF